MAESLSGGSWWGGWLQTAKEKSTSALDFMKKDLAEFTNVMQKDTTNAAETVKEKITQETASEATRKVKDSVTSLLGGISKALVIEPEDKNYRGEPITADSHLFDRAKARLHAIQLDPETYCAEPGGPSEQFDAWLTDFVLEDQKGAISELLVSNVQVRSLYTQLVPSEVSHACFWQRYFYKVHQLEQDEARKAALKRRADAGTQEAELEWDDDEWGDIDTSSQVTLTTTSTSSTGEWTRVDTHLEDAASGTAHTRLTESQSPNSTTGLTSDHKKRDSDLTPFPDPNHGNAPSQPTTSTADLTKLEVKTTIQTQAQQVETEHCDRTLIHAVSSSSIDQVVAPTGEEHEQLALITLPVQKNALPDEKETLKVGAQAGDDVVVVGTERNTPSSDSSQSKEVSSLDDDWEKDFDIEVSEEDIRLAQEAARKLTDDGVSGAVNEDDDDWENWD